jgi:hypothetical protein
MIKDFGRPMGKSPKLASSFSSQTLTASVTQRFSKPLERALKTGVHAL